MLAFVFAVTAIVIMLTFAPATAGRVCFGITSLFLLRNLLYFFMEPDKKKYLIENEEESNSILLFSILWLLTAINVTVILPLTIYWYLVQCILFLAYWFFDPKLVDMNSWWMVIAIYAIAVTFMADGITKADNRPIHTDVVEQLQFYDDYCLVQLKETGKIYATPANSRTLHIGDTIQFRKDQDWCQFDWLILVDSH